MLNENIKKLRKSKGLSQEELAIKLNVVRQTVSKWENGLSVPDSSMLIALADELDTSVGVLLGEPVTEPIQDDLKVISEKLEVINLQLAKKSMAKVKTIRWVLISFCALIVIVFIILAAMQSSYLGWDYNNPELAVAGTMMHGFEFYTPTRVIFGAGSLEKLPEAVGRCGAKRVFVIYGGQSAKKSGTLDRVEALLTGAGIAFAAIGGVKPNPRLGLAR